jgi:uncharacterized membrane protein HdeD (DUF308 family)
MRSPASRPVYVLTPNDVMPKWWRIGAEGISISSGAGLFVGLPIEAVIALITLITLVRSCYGMCEKMRTFAAHGVDRT